MTQLIGNRNHIDHVRDQYDAFNHSDQTCMFYIQYLSQQGLVSCIFILLAFEDWFKVSKSIQIPKIFFLRYPGIGLDFSRFFLEPVNPNVTDSKSHYLLPPRQSDVYTNCFILSEN